MIEFVKRRFVEIEGHKVLALNWRTAWMFLHKKKASDFWCKLLIEQKFNDNCTKLYLRGSALGEGYCTKNELEGLLEKSGLGHGREWYEENYTYQPTEDTVVSVIKLLKPRLISQSAPASPGMQSHNAGSSPRESLY